MDAQALVGVANLSHQLGLTSVMYWVSRAGNFGECWIVLGVVLLCFKRSRWAGLAVLLAIALSSMLGPGLLKTLVARPRPCSVMLPDFLQSCPQSFSFPSGHTAAAFAAATVLWVRKSPLAIPVFALAFLMGVSRMALFVHYPTDVMAGALLGIASGIAASMLVETLRTWYERRHAALGEKNL